MSPSLILEARLACSSTRGPPTSPVTEGRLEHFIIPIPLLSRRLSISEQGNFLKVSFPGGKVDDGDASIVDTALRESEEEIGLFKDQVDSALCLGLLD